ncbi:ATP-binding protein, partial [Streptomyces sp. NPDC059524]|uniref:ATP-binding protein n=1 Tax=Streptomyces sp. NPDC059524 TaxID=3346856 RepID=UPI00369ADFC1
MNTPNRSMPLRHALTVPAEGSAVRLARETAQMVLAEWGVNPGHPAVDPALLILSELVTNSVRHAAALAPTVTVVFAGGADCLAFGVHDRHPDRPSLHEAAAGAPPPPPRPLHAGSGGSGAARPAGRARAPPRADRAGYDP